MLVVTACLQGTLLAMAIYFEYFGPNGKQKQQTDETDAPSNGTGSERPETPAARESADAERPSEETPLLQSQ